MRKLPHNSKIFSLLLLLSLFPSPFIALSFAQTITGKVIKIADGDTITILNNHNQQTKIRLYGIDTPESKQAFGKKAKNSQHH